MSTAANNEKNVSQKFLFIYCYTLHSSFEKFRREKIVSHSEKYCKSFAFLSFEENLDCSLLKATHLGFLLTLNIFYFRFLSQKFSLSNEHSIFYPFVVVTFECLRRFVRGPTMFSPEILLSQTLRVVNNDLPEVSLCPHLHRPSINCPSYPFHSHLIVMFPLMFRKEAANGKEKLFLTA